MCKKKPAFQGLMAMCVLMLLSACGGSGSDGGTDTGSISVDVTDLPVTEDVAVCIHFSSITLHHAEGDLIEIPYDASNYTDASACIDNLPAEDPLAQNNAVNLSALQGELTQQLVQSEQVKAGHYNWIRLDVDETLSYVMDPGGQQALRCPSCDGDQSGLKLNRGIDVPAGGEAAFVIDIELSKSLHKEPSGGYRLRPTLRLVDLSETGKIKGTVAPSLIPEMLSETDTGCRIYVYEGHDVLPDDQHETDNVLTTAKVLYDPETMDYTYVAAFLPVNSETGVTAYTIALTCDEDDVELDQNNDPQNPAGNDVIFTDGVSEGMGQNVDVVSNQATTADFPPL